MINSGYFTSRNEILQWINNLLLIEVTKIEQLGSGNIYCQILDAAYPQKIPLNKVKWNAYLQIDFLHNFKVLQTAFDRLGINKFIDTQKLVKAKYQDNLELIQWMKWRFDPLIKENKLYDALGRRNQNQVYLLFTGKLTDSKIQRNKQNKENMIKSVTTNNSNSLKSYRSIQNMKTLPIVQSIKRAVNTKQNKRSFDFKKNKIQHVLGQRKIVENVKLVQSDEEQCF